MKNIIEYSSRRAPDAKPGIFSVDAALNSAPEKRFYGHGLFIFSNVPYAPDNDNNPFFAGACAKLIARIHKGLLLVFSRRCAMKAIKKHCPRHGVSCPRFSPR